MSCHNYHMTGSVRIHYALHVNACIAMMNDEWWKVSHTELELIHFFLSLMKKCNLHTNEWQRILINATWTTIHCVFKDIFSPSNVKESIFILHVVVRHCWIAPTCEIIDFRYRDDENYSRAIVYFQKSEKLRNKYMLIISEVTRWLHEPRLGQS